MTVPGLISTGSPRLAMASAAAARSPALNASRRASAAVRRSPFVGEDDMRHYSTGGHHTFSSGPGLSRASTSFWSGKDLDGRDKPGHDGIEKQKREAAVAVGA